MILHGGKAAGMLILKSELRTCNNYLVVHKQKGSLTSGQIMEGKENYKKRARRYGFLRMLNIC